MYCVIKDFCMHPASNLYLRLTAITRTMPNPNIARFKSLKKDRCCDWNPNRYDIIFKAICYTLFGHAYKINLALPKIACESKNKEDNKWRDSDFYVCKQRAMLWSSFRGIEV